MSDFKMRHYQLGALDAFAEAIKIGQRNLLETLPTGTGKCFALGTPILMYNGTIKAVEDVVPGDLLMGPDSKSRKVLSLGRGREMMYRITPSKGNAYVVNESHILSLKMVKGASHCTGARGGEYAAGTVINIPVAEYLQRSKTFKHCTHGYRSAVTFSHKLNTLSPYFLGLWLGQGNENTHNIVNPEPETTVVLSDLAIAYNLRLIIRKQENGSLNYSINGSSLEDNPVLWHLRNLNLLNNKHIPEEYKANSRDVQLQVLAGLLDSAGKVTRNGYDLMLKDKQLVQDVLFLVRSLGLAAYSWPYLKLDRVTGVTTEHSQVNITGDCSIIPLRVSSKVPKRLPKCKDVLSVSITVEPVGIDDYYGFEIDGDRLFLLGDFTVVHNTVIFVRAAKHAGLEGTVLI